MEPEVLASAIVDSLREARRHQKEIELQRHHFCHEGFMIIYDPNKVKEYLKTRYNLSINGLACLGNLTQLGGNSIFDSVKIDTNGDSQRRGINPNVAKAVFEIAYECFDEHFLRRDALQSICHKCNNRCSIDVYFQDSLEGLRELLVKNAASICINLEPLLLKSTSTSRLKMCDVLLQPCISDNQWITQDPTLFGLFVTCFNRIFTNLPPSPSSSSSTSEAAVETEPEQRPISYQDSHFIRQEWHLGRQERRRKQREEVLSFSPQIPHLHHPRRQETQALLHADIRDLIRDKIVGAINDNVLANSNNPEHKEALLSALWNLTDENPFACQTLVDVGGLEFLVKLMKHVDNYADEAERSQDLIRIMGILLNVGLCRSTRKKIEQKDVKKLLVHLIDDAIGVKREAARKSSNLLVRVVGGVGDAAVGDAVVVEEVGIVNDAAAADAAAAALAANEDGEAGQAGGKARNPMLGFLASGILAAIACDDPQKIRTWGWGFLRLNNSSGVLKKIKMAVKSLSDPFLGNGVENNNNNNNNVGVPNNGNIDNVGVNNNGVNNNNAGVNNNGVNNNNNDHNENNELEISLGFTSFKSIFTMLKKERPSAVHHWALWGVANACSAQPHRHLPMLQREGGFELLEGIVKHDKDPEVKNLAKRLLLFTQEFFNKTNKTSS